MSEDKIIETKNLTKHFPIFSKHILRAKQIGVVHACENVSFTITKGKTLGLVGESGCGKTTTARVILGLTPATLGEVYFNGENVLPIFQSKKKDKILELRRRMQLVFQNPYSSLNPRFLVRDILMEPLQVHKPISRDDWTSRVQDELTLVGLEEYHADRYPHEFSGGQRQRICIARALILRPEFLILDEAVSALDVSIRAGILNLLVDLQEKFSLTYLYISHDLSTVRHISHSVAVMYLGCIVEMGNCNDIFQSPLHPYTRALMSSIPRIRSTGDKSRIVLHGEVPSPVNPPPGCRFHPRCQYAMPICKKKHPRLERIHNRLVACYLCTD